MFLNRRIILVFALLFLFSSAFGKKILFAVGTYKISSLMKAVSAFSDYSSEIAFVTEKTPKERVIKLALGVRVVVLDVMLKNLADTFIELKEKGKLKAKVYCVNSSTDDEELKKIGFVFDEKLKMYYNNPVALNYRNLIAYVLSLSGYKVEFEAPVVLPRSGIYHPDASYIFKSLNEYIKWYSLRKKPKYWIGIIFYQSYLDPSHQTFLDYLIKKLEKTGLGVVAAYGYPAERALTFFTDFIKPEIVLSFAFKMSTSNNPGTIRKLRRLNVPIINLINLFSERVPEWVKSSTGLSSFEVSWQLNMPELSGLIEPFVVSGRVRKGEIDVYRPVKSEIDWLVDRIFSWVRLRHKPNGKKKIAIIYYNHAPGKQNIGASYLNVFESIRIILESLKKAGYKVGNIPDSKTLKKLLLLTGRNIGQWAPGELEKLMENKSIIKIPLPVYEKWYQELPTSFRQAVERDWGTPEECNIMKYKGYIIIPGIILGNVFIGPQPARGVAGDAWKIYHSTKVYPHHQYIAFYLWLRKSFKADVLVHLGTHGTLEWLPGKQAGLSHKDPSYLLHFDMVDVYPYVVDDVGEGIQAKRRGLAVVIDHLTPPVVKAGLYGEYSRLSDLLNQIETTFDERVKKEKERRAWELAKSLGLVKELKLGSWDEETKEKLVHKLIRIKEDLIPYGLHVFGVSPSGKALNEFAKIIGTRKAREKLLVSGFKEMRSLLKAFSGGYIEAGVGNDPVRNPESIPTGKNFYAFDPTKVPSPEAWKVAVKLTYNMLEKYKRKHGRYPDKVSIVLWATETVRNEGINEAKALYLMGIKPVWDKRGKVIGLTPIPADVLKRPRIDVLIHASGLYRDMFPHMLKLLDKAVKVAATLHDTENFISKHAELLKEWLVKSGIKLDKAKRLSLVRVFSEEPGSYGTGVALMTANTGYWNKPEQIASVFINRTGFAFGEDMWGVKEHELYKMNLAEIDVAVHSISSNLYRALDNDDVFQYLGGITLTVKALAGKFPEAEVVRSTGSESWVEDLEETLAQESIVRYYNPKWIKGMMKEGYAGAREMAKFVEYLWGWQVTAPFAVDNNMWEKAYNVYVLDRYRLDLKKFFDKENPWAYQSIVAWMLEAIRKGYWRASRKVKVDLARRYAESVIRKGVACCEHTCNNPFLNRFVVNILSTPGVVSSDLAVRFETAIEKATGENINKAARERESLLKRLATGVERIVKGIELRKEKQAKEKPVSSGIQEMLMLFALVVTLIFMWGLRKGEA